MICKIVFKREIAEDGYILKKMELPFFPSGDLVIDDGTGDDMEFKKPRYCLDGVPNGYDGASFLVNLDGITLDKLGEFEAMGWVLYNPPEEE